MDHRFRQLVQIYKLPLINSCYFWIPFIIIIWPTFPSKITIGNQIAFIVMIFILAITWLLGIYKIHITKNLIIIGTYFSGIAIWNIILEISRNKIEINDYFEILRPVGFLLCYEYYRYSTLSIDQLENITFKFIVYTFSLIGCYCIAEFIIPETLRPASFLLWKRETVGILHNKAIGTFFQTYNCAYAFLIPYFISFILLFRKPNLKNLLFFSLMLITQLLTQSKSMYLCLGLGTIILIFVVTDFHNKKSILRTSSVIGVIFFSLGSLFLIYKDFIMDTLSYAFTGFEAISDGSSGSLNTRQAQIQWAVENNGLGFIGFGVGKSQILLESLYALYYYRYGLIGISIVVILTLCTSYMARKNYKCTHGRCKVLYESLFVFFLLNPLALTSSCHQDMPKTCLLFYGMIGLIFARGNKQSHSKTYNHLNINETQSS